MGGRRCRGKRIWCLRHETGAMKRALRFALSRFVIPAYLALEVFVTLEVASRLGAGPTLLALLLGAAAGIAVLRTQRLSTLARLRQTIAAGEPMLPGLLDGALRAMAGVLLIIPGFISDAAAAGLLVPRLRQRLVRRLSAGLGHVPQAGPVAIEGDYRKVDETALPEPNENPGDADPARTDRAHARQARRGGTGH
jgi:UPF0716 protein FxsA